MEGRKEELVVRKEGKTLEEWKKEEPWKEGRMEEP
jgi:hypothetical protein